MNKQRKNQIEQLREIIEKAKDNLVDLATEERDAFDNLSEGLQQTERGQQSEAAADELDSAIASLEDVVNSLDNIE